MTSCIDCRPRALLMLTGTLTLEPAAPDRLPMLSRVLASIGDFGCMGCAAGPIVDATAMRPGTRAATVTLLVTVAELCVPSFTRQLKVRLTSAPEFVGFALVELYVTESRTCW